MTSTVAVGQKNPYKTEKGLPERTGCLPYTYCQFPSLTYLLLLAYGRLN